MRKFVKTLLSGQFFLFRKFLLSTWFLVCASCADVNSGAADNRQLADQCAHLNINAETVNIPAGKYRIGDERFYPEERPVQTIELAGFNIDATEVTNREFAEFVEATGYVTRAERGLPEAEYSEIPSNLRTPGSAVFTPPLKSDSFSPATWWRFVDGASWRAPQGPGSSIEGLENHPVVHVAFEDALAYAQWKGRRLPTEYEWEAAARSRNNLDPYAWGQKAPAELEKQPANTWQGLFPVINQKTDGYGGTAPVGCYEPNANGLYDMIGNVWELTSSEYAPIRDRVPQDIIHDLDAQPFAYGVIKGGSYLCAENYCLRYRPSARQPHEWALGASHIGFRTAMSYK